MEEEAQQKYMEFQVLSQQIAQLQKQMQLLENQSMELMSVEQALDELKDTKAGTKILVPVSSGIFVKAELQDSKELLVNVGANVTVKKDIPSTKELIHQQIDEIKKLEEETMVELQTLAMKANSIEEEINKQA